MYINDLEHQVSAYPGSMLKAKSQGLWPDHLGILGEPLPDGRWSVVHSDERGVVLTAFEDFARGRLVTVLQAPCSLEQQRSILERAFSQIGHPYDVLFANCEHFATWAFNGVADSPQLKKCVAGACVLVLGLARLWSLGGESA